MSRYDDVTKGLNGPGYLIKKQVILWGDEGRVTLNRCFAPHNVV
jgi:hypothetical protein